jgi:hypothetical protein
MLAANTAYPTLPNMCLFVSKQIHRNNKISLYEILCYGSVTWTLTQMTEQILYTFDKKILRRIYLPVQDKGRWQPR